MPDPASLVGEPTRRRAGVFRRALRREASRLRDRRRLTAMAILIVVFGVVAAGLAARGELSGADARAYWAGVRIWLSGGDPYHPTGPFLPFVYAPWMLPLFAPWALLPWDVAWVVWRGTTILLLFWTIDWAYRRRPLETALVAVFLAFPMAANLDTGNITLLLALAVWYAQFCGPRLAGLLWGLATWMKWAPAPLWLVLAPRARAWGLVWLAASVLLSLATLPMTIVQLQALFGFGARPIRLDYLVLFWPLVPFLWRRDEPFGWLRPSAWRAFAQRVREAVARREVSERVRAFLGLGA
jgi:Glycosyltransferase family 87